MADVWLFVPDPEGLLVQTAVELREGGPSSVVTGCARCGGTHDVAWMEFGRPCGEFTHWGMCPMTGEPVLMRVTTHKGEDDG